MKSVYNAEKEIKKPFYLNTAILSIFFDILFLSTVFYFYGLQAVIMLLISAVGALFYLGVINYVEHYGLRRKKLQNG